MIMKIKQRWSKSTVNLKNMNFFMEQEVIIFNEFCCAYGR